MEISKTINRRPTASSGAKSASVTKALLGCGIAVAPVFLVVAFGQVAARGFDIRHLAISMLSLGDFGWIQIGNFFVTGLLALACAVGMRRTLRNQRAGTWGPVLIAVCGIGTITAGIFHPDPAFGFPPGAPAGMPATMSSHATVHQLAFSISFLAVIVACFVFSRFFAASGNLRWVIYCIATGVVTPVLIALGINDKDWSGLILVVVAVVGLGWISAASARLLSEVRPG